MSPAPNSGPRRALWVLGPLLIVAAIGVRQYLRASRVGAANASDAARMGPAPEASRVPSASTRAPRFKVGWPVELQRDPFRSDVVFPPAVKQAPRTGPEPAPVDQAKLLADAREKLKLTAVFLGETPTAMINGRLYRVGSVVAGYRIVEITRREIIVQTGKTRLQLSCE
jgi:hypothetical protein